MESKRSIRPNPLALDRFLSSSATGSFSNSIPLGPPSLNNSYPSSPAVNSNKHTSAGMKLAMFSTTKYVDEQRGDFKQFRPAVHPPNVLENISDSGSPHGQTQPLLNTIASPMKPMRTAAEIWKDGMYEQPDQVTEFSRSNEHKDRLRLAPVSLKGGRVVPQQFQVEETAIQDTTTFVMLPSQRRKAFQHHVDQQRAKQVATKARRAENQLNRIILHQYPHGFLGGETTMSENTQLYSEKSEQNKKVQARMVELTQRRKRWIELNENKPGSGGKGIIQHLDKSEVRDTTTPADQKGVSGGFKFLQSKVRCGPTDNFSLGTMCCASAAPRTPSPRRQQLLSYCDGGDKDYNILSGAAVTRPANPFA